MTTLRETGSIIAVKNKETNKYDLHNISVTIYFTKRFLGHFVKFSRRVCLQDFLARVFLFFHRRMGMAE